MTGQIKLTYAGRDCTEKDVTIITTGSVETVTAAFAFDAEWDGFARTAIFSSGGTVKRVVLDDANACVVPWEVLTNCKQLTIGVVGTSGNRVLPSVPVTIPIIDGVCNGGTPPDDPTPDIYAQLLDLAKETQQIAQSVRDDANAGKFNGAPGTKGEPGADGYTPVKGVDYWTPAEAEEMDAAKTAANNAADNASVAEAAALNAASMADEAASSASISAQNADTAAGEARAKAAELQAKADAGDFDGQDGYTPVRGTDYWTDADKAAINADIAAQVAGKVDKVDGKGLSANDYTDADKAAVAGLRTPFAHIGDIEITESGTKIAVKDNLALRMAVVLITIQDGSPALNVEFKFDDNNTATRYCSNLNSGRVAVELKNGIPWLDYSFIKGADTSSQTALGMPNSAFRAYATYAATKITRIRIIGMNNAELLAGSKFEIYGVTV